MRSRVIALAIGLVFLVSLSTFAGAPYETTYQGRLLLNGNPVTAPTSITFDLFENKSGGGTLWTDTQSVTPNSEGIYTVTLGSQSNPLPTNYDTLWLHLKLPTIFYSRPVGFREFTQWGPL